MSPVAYQGKGVTAMAAQLLTTSMPCMRQSFPQPSRLLTGKHTGRIVPSTQCLRSSHARMAHRSSRASIVTAVDADKVLAEAVGEGKARTYNFFCMADSVFCALRSCRFLDWSPFIKRIQSRCMVLQRRRSLILRMKMTAAA